MVKLPRVPEPVEVRRKFAEDLRNAPKGSLEEMGTIGNIKQGTWFTSSYYRTFKDELLSQGVSWQVLMEAYGIVNSWFVLWAKGKVQWSDVMNRLEEAVNAVLKEKRKEA